MLRIALVSMTACAAVCIAACAPVRVRQQPRVQFHIESAQGQPLSGAVLHFERYSVRPLSSGGPPLIETTESSDANGNIQLSERFEWQAALLVPDAGPTNYRWEWCIDRTGFAPEFGKLAFNAEVPARIAVVLKPDAKGDRCPEATSSGYRAGP